MTGACYECGTEVPTESREAFRRALQAFADASAAARRSPDDPEVARHTVAS
jgi:hypothetical protein